MKCIFKFTLLTVLTLASATSAFAISAERLLNQRTLNGRVTEFSGRASSVLDMKMLNIHTFMTFSKTYTEGSGWRVSFTSNGNRWTHRSHDLYSTTGEVEFALTDEEGEPQDFIMGNGDNKITRTFMKKDKTLYVVESEFDFKRRVNRARGKFIAIVEFDAYSPYKADFYEVKEVEAAKKLTHLGTYR
jgi:hypothetical protein